MVLRCALLPSSSSILRLRAATRGRLRPLLWFVHIAFRLIFPVAVNRNRSEIDELNHAPSGRHAAGLHASLNSDGNIF